jgi:hypothetical protein
LKSDSLIENSMSDNYRLSIYGSFIESRQLWKIY